MNNNDLFLSKFMQTVDLNLFTPSLYQYLVKFLELEKVRKYGDQFVISTFIPPFPSPAFDRFIETYFIEGKRTPIQSVDLAVTNACMFNCWHCYNAGRLLKDLSLKQLQKIISQLEALGALVINFTGGEPCLRHDIVEICSSLGEDTYGILATTGYGFTDKIARNLSRTQVYSISISLDSADEKEHDTKRGVKGAFQIALKGIETALKWGFYTYTCAVPSKKLLQEDNFRKLVGLNKKLGVHELQLIEPAPAGKIVAAELDFGEEEFEKVFQYMGEYNQQDGDFAISSFAHMESPEFFGCGAGFSHIYIDGSGEVSPCNMIPITYGNAAREDLTSIVTCMQTEYQHPCQNCLAHLLKDYYCECSKVAKPAPVGSIPSFPLPEQPLPGFFQIMQDSKKEIAGNNEIITGYNDASSTYEDYWLSVASGPIEELFEKLKINSNLNALDCGCGTGFSTARLAERVGRNGKVLGIDLSPGMINSAKRRMQKLHLTNVEFRINDVLEELKRIPAKSFDIAVMTWLIGYVGCWEIFPLLKRILKPDGVIGFVAHLDRSPLVPIELFEEITREDPECLMKAVRLKFPKDAQETVKEIETTGLKTKWIKHGTFDYICHQGREVYDHVMKSGAGTTFYYSIRPSDRERIAEEFIRRLDNKFRDADQINIVHEYIVGIASN